MEGGTMLSPGKQEFILGQALERKIWARFAGLTTKGDEFSLCGRQMVVVIHS
jgi:hypothetical protein